MPPKDKLIKYSLYGEENHDLTVYFNYLYSAHKAGKITGLHHVTILRHCDQGRLDFSVISHDRQKIHRRIRGRDLIHFMDVRELLNSRHNYFKEVEPTQE